MKLTGVALAGVRRTGLLGTWFRCFPIAFGQQQLNTAYSLSVLSRFSGGRRLRSGDQYEVLYLAETRFVALCEFRALVGLPLSGSVMAFPRGPFRTAAFQVRLAAVVDLVDVAVSQNRLRTSAQELTGDWQANQLRAGGSAVPGITVPAPKGLAPTQELGLALHQAPGVEGILSLSSVVPTRRILVAFPRKLSPGSRLSYRYRGQGFVLDDTGLVATP